MSCWIIPSHFGSGYLPDPAGFSMPWSGARRVPLHWIVSSPTAAAPAAGRRRIAAAARAATSAAARRGWIRGIPQGIDAVRRIIAQLSSVVLVLDALGVRAAIALELRLD